MTASVSAPIQKILVAGNGIEAWLSAGLLARRLAGSGLTITVCPVAESHQWDALYSILPAHPEDAVNLMGISDLDLVLNCAGSFSLGARFHEMGQVGPAAFKPYGPSGINFQGVEFHHYWKWARQSGEGPPYLHYSPGYQAMQRGLYAPPVPRNAIGPLQHEVARHVDPWMLRKYLRHAAYELGVVEHPSWLAAVERDQRGAIRGLRMHSGALLEADLYLDCSGPLQSLVKDAPGFDWLEAICSASYAVTIDAQKSDDPPPPWHHVTARENGWLIQIPTLAERVDIRFSPAQADAQPVFRPGHIARAWLGNTLALGHSAAQLLPTEPVQVLYLMASLERLVQYLPAADHAPAETHEYNQLANRDLELAHQWLALHELTRIHGRLDPSDLQETGPQGMLRRRLQLFARRGWLIPEDSELVAAHAWPVTCLFHGLEPSGYSLLAERIDQAALVGHLADLQRRIGQVIAEFPPHDVYLNAIIKQALEAAQKPQPASNRS